VFPPDAPDKDALRRLHAAAVHHSIDLAKGGLDSIEDALLSRIANGSEVDPSAIVPQVIEVHPKSNDELLFRYAGLHWSVPVSAGYGRRLRFLVIDQSNQKLVGIFGLADPVYNLGPRDTWIGWSPQQKRDRLRHVMDAYVLGAVPPYSMLLCGKLVALIATSEEVRHAFYRKYKGERSRIRRKEPDARLAMITTSSALGRSSLYNRLRFDGRAVFQSIGLSRGTGDFHFSNGQYEHLLRYANRYCIPTERKSRWGKGFRNRREVVWKCLAKMGLTKQWLSHGVGRELFVAPLASNVRSFLCGDSTRLNWYNQGMEDLYQFFRERWLIPRSNRLPDYREWDREKWRLWRPRT